MASLKYRKGKRTLAIDKLDELVRNRIAVLIIHYSCESFFDLPQGKTSRITSIAVRYFSSGQTRSFSIHKVAERNGIISDQIQDKYDELEKEMLDDFYEFLGQHATNYWVHWNMRNIQYGFDAISHRYSVLNGSPIKIEDNKKVDLSRLLIDKYGDDYIDHPRLFNLCKKNKIDLRRFLIGDQEAKVFENQDYVKLHYSTLQKVDAIEHILDKSIDDSLKNQSNFLKLYGFTPQGLFEISKESWFMAFILFVLGVFFGKILSVVFSRIYTIFA